ncbi:uncharacterized protein LOC143238083 [Tachypleus tridentatus]|uniref:uncharacterized protein LOC143238083 n=1 Tax=Tachypleus tridentatus TaxID=6853 RepID=UPI003FD0CA6E
MPHHHCCVIGCKSDSRYTIPDPDDTPLKFFCIPSATTKKDLHNKWMELIRRPDLSVSRNTRVCSRHFVDGRPTLENPLPIQNLTPASEHQIYLTNCTNPHQTLFGIKNQGTCLRKYYPGEKSKNISNKETSQKSVNLLAVKKQKLEVNSRVITDDILSNEIYFAQPVLHEYKSTQTSYFAKQTLTKSTQTESVENDDLTCSQRKFYSSSKTLPSTLLPFMQVKLPVPLNITFLKNDSMQFCYYTGFKTYTDFQTYFVEAASKLNIFSFHQDYKIQKDHEFGESKSSNLIRELSTLSLENALLLVLMVKNLSLQFHDVAHKFQVSVSTVQYLMEKLSPILNKEIE